LPSMEIQDEGQSHDDQPHDIVSCAVNNCRNEPQSASPLQVYFMG
jgi:hypothetical protein